MRRLLKKLLNYFGKKRKRKALLKKRGFEIVYKKDTSIVFGCFNFSPLKKNGKIDLLDHNGNVLKKDIFPENADKYIIEYENAARKKYPKLSKEDATKKHLNDLSGFAKIRKILDDYISFRSSLSKLDETRLLARYKRTINVRHFKTKELVAFYKRIKYKYPKFKRGINFAEFTIKSKVHNNIKILSHSGKDQLYSTFTKSITDLKFLENVKAIGGRQKWNDSEIKFIYEFLTKHINLADDFVIESKNIYYACTSCQRELIMLVEYAKSVGKKIDLRIYGDIDIKGQDELFLKINKYLK